MPNRKFAGGGVAGSAAAPLASQNLPVRRVLELVTSRLRDGGLVPGQTIIARDIAAELGLSAAPVREALHILAGQGVVELLPQRSPRIRSLSMQDMIDILAVWRGLGAVGVRLAAENIKKGKSAALVRKALEDVVAAEHRSAIDLLSATVQYSKVLDEIAGNPYLPIVKGQLHFSHLHRHLAPYWPGSQSGLIVRNLRRITDLILKGDARGAEVAFMKHLDQAIEYVQAARDAA